MAGLWPTWNNEFIALKKTIFCYTQIGTAENQHCSVAFIVKFPILNFDNIYETSTGTHGKILLWP